MKSPDRERVPRQATPHRRAWHNHYLHQRELLAAVRGASPFIRGRLLDVGCGNRPYARELPGATQYIGVDAVREAGSPDALALGTALPFTDASFDTALCFQVLEHVENPFGVMREIARVLRPGAHLVLSAPQAWRLHEEPHDFFRYTRFGLEQLARQAGLETVQITAQGGVWVNVATTVNNALERRLRGRAPKHVLNGAFLVSNAWFGALDRVWRDDGDTNNYLLVARKP